MSTTDLKHKIQLDVAIHYFCVEKPAENFRRYSFLSMVLCSGGGFPNAKLASLQKVLSSEFFAAVREVYEHVYETVDLSGSVEVRANATAKVRLPSLVLYKRQVVDLSTDKHYAWSLTYYVNYFTTIGKERKGTRTCIAPIVITTSKRSDVDHTELPANTPHLPFLRSTLEMTYIVSGGALNSYSLTHSLTPFLRVSIR